MQKVWKQFLLLGLIFAMTMGVVACGTQNEEEPENSAVVETKTPQEDEKAEKKAKTETDDKEEEEEKKDEKPAEKSKDEPKETEKPKETKAQEPAPQPAETPEPAQESAPAVTAATASQYIGQSTSSLVAAIGQPTGKTYASSCIGEGQDGEWYYPGFTVYTYKAPDGSERVEDVM